VAKKATYDFTWMRCRAKPPLTVVDWQRIQTPLCCCRREQLRGGMSQISLWHNYLQRFWWWSLKASSLIPSPTAAYQEEYHEKIK
jgi:hypothetical protein